MVWSARKLERHLEEKAIGHEERKLRQRAARLRQQRTPAPARARVDPGLADPDAWLDDQATVARERRTAGRAGNRESLVAWVDRLRSPLEPAADAGGRRGTVESAAHGACRVRSGEEELGALTRLPVVVGDEVVVAERSGVFTVREVLPRRTRLSRPDPHRPEREQVMAANVDLGVIVVALGSPPLRPGLVDRFLVALEAGGVEPLVCVNKLDLVTARQRATALAALAPYRELGVGAVFCSAASGEGIAELEAALAGRVGVLVGQSGVGKTSLLNALDPRLDLRTRAPRSGDGKGRHTTTAAGLYALPGGGRLIDTPGLRQFGLWEIAPRELGALFPEIAALAGGCRFRDCRHATEPACAVKEAAAAGALPAARYASYRRILDSL